MAGLKKYVEWMSRGRKTDRVAYAIREWDLPEPSAGAEWVADKSFNAAEEVLRDPGLERCISVGDRQGEEMKMPWSREEEDRLRKLLLGNVRPDKIAKDLSRSAAAVKSKAHAMGLTVAQIGNFRRRRLSKWG